MFENDGNERRARPMILQHPVTAGLVAVNVAIYVFQYYFADTVLPDFSIDEHFALSREGLRAGHYWQLLTYQFLHGGLLHVAFNCWAIYVFGQVIESFLGWKRMLVLYLTGGVVGGLFQMISAWLRPDFFDGPVIGASAGACALLAAFATLFPLQRMLVLLFFVIPVSMKARTMLRVMLGVTLLGLFWPFLQELPVLHRPLAALDHWFDSNVGLGSIAHGGHLGGLVTGILFSIWLIRKYGPVTTVSRPPAN